MSRKLKKIIRKLEVEFNDLCNSLPKTINVEEYSRLEQLKNQLDSAAQELGFRSYCHYRRKEEIVIDKVVGKLTPQQEDEIEDLITEYKNSTKLSDVEIDNLVIKHCLEKHSNITYKNLIKYLYSRKDRPGFGNDWRDPDKGWIDFIVN